MEYKEDFEHEFLKPFKYASGGDEVLSQKIVIPAPSNRLLEQISTIEKEYRKSELKMVESFKNVIGEEAFANLMKEREDQDKSKDQDSEMTPNAVISSMMGGGSNMVKCFSALKIILKKSIVDGETKMTPSMFDDMSPIDTKEILGKYIINFLVISQQD